MTKTYKITPASFAEKSAVINISGDSGQAEKPSPLGKVKFAWQYDRATELLAVTVLRTPLFVTQDEVFRKIGDGLGCEAIS